MRLKKSKTKEYDYARCHAFQAPIGKGRMYRVMYRHREDPKWAERKSAWFSKESTVQEAYNRMVRKHGEDNAIIYMD